MHPHYFLITIFSHHFSCTHITSRGKELCLLFSKRLVQYGYVPDRGQMRRVPLKVYAATTQERTEFRFHINSYKEFIEFLTLHHCQKDMYLVEHKEMFLPELIELPVKPQWVPRDYQIPIIDYLVNPLPISKLVGLRTGGGKSLSSLLAISKIGYRFCIIIKPMYIEKWIDDVLKTYDIDPSDIVVIQGSAALLTLLDKIKDNTFTAKCIIMSNTTYANWLKLYSKFAEETLDLGYPFAPYEFFEKGKIGIRLIDEVHQHYHTCFKVDLYTHIPGSISLSATMITEDPFMERMYLLGYPLHDRHKDTSLVKYINSYAVHFRFNKPDHIRTKEYGSNNYSHNAVESSIMKHVPTRLNYLNLIDYTIQIGYLKCERKKKRLLIFAYSISFIDVLLTYLKGKYPRFDIRRYVAADDYSNLMEADICISTLGSSGTLVDIADLTTVILTTTVNSIAANVQSLGRLRELKDGTAPEFYYLVCDDIPKSVEYHGKKKEMLGHRAASFREIYSGFIV